MRAPYLFTCFRVLLEMLRELQGCWYSRACLQQLLFRDWQRPPTSHCGQTMHKEDIDVCPSFRSSLEPSLQTSSLFTDPLLPFLIAADRNCDCSILLNRSIAISIFLLDKSKHGLQAPSCSLISALEAAFQKHGGAQVTSHDTCLVTTPAPWTD